MANREAPRKDPKAAIKNLLPLRQITVNREEAKTISGLDGPDNRSRYNVLSHQADRVDICG
jgi:hypothetical protein